MGASSSIDLRPEEVDELVEETAYAPKEVKTLYKRFRRLDRAGRGTIAVDDLTMIPEVVMNPLSGRIVEMFEKDSDGRINFRSFLRELSNLNEARSPTDKAAHMFRLFDVDGDGAVSPADLHAVLRMMTGSSLAPDVAADVVARTIAAGDADGDGVLCAAEFVAAVRGYPWAGFTVPVKSSNRMEYFAAENARTTGAFGGPFGGTPFAE